MDGFSPSHAQPGAPVPKPGFGRSPINNGSPGAMGVRWAALHEAAAVVAALARAAPLPMRPEVRAFPAIMRAAGGWRRNMAEQGLDDIAAMMEPGLAALLSGHAQGRDTIPAAGALWEEFTAARDALLTLAPRPAPHFG